MGREVQIETSPKYEFELDEILDFIGESNPMNALNFAQELDFEIKNLLHNPYKFRQSTKLNNKNIRDLIFKGYVIPYLIEVDKIVILGIFNRNRWGLNS